MTKFIKKDRGKPPKVNNESRIKSTDKIVKKFADAFGTTDLDIISLTTNDLINILPSSLRENAMLRNAAFAMVHDLNPTDTFERMIVVQMVACHFMIMEFSSMSMTSTYSEDVIDKYVNRVAKLLRAYNNHSEALQKYRGKGQQTIQVQHVNIQDNAQAVIGSVTGG